MKLHIVVDFAETLVKERPMIEWVLFELKNREVSMWQRLRFMLDSFTRGFLSIVLGRFRITSKWAARVAYMSFSGLNEESLERLVNHRKRDSTYILNLNPELMEVLWTIRQERSSDPSQPLGISIYSQGTCARAIELFTRRRDVVEALDRAGLYISSIVANQLEAFGDRFTGRLTGRIVTKHSKPREIPNGSIFVGDNHDEKVIGKLKDRAFEFINYKKASID